MSHLGEKIAEYVLEEMSVLEMKEAGQHLAQCADCRRQVEEFQGTHAMLRTLSDVEPPRRIVFEVEKPAASGWAWRWLAPLGSAVAASVLTAMLMIPRAVPAPQISERVSPQPAQQAIAQPVDYQRIVNEVRASDQAWFTAQLQQRDIAQTKEIQRVRGVIELLDRQQLAAHRETLQTAAMIQQIVPKTASED